MSSEEKYETLEKIGHGSFGIIRKVRRKQDGFIMCRKEISYLRMSQKEREQLHAEFQILSHLRHPNIVAYYHREHLKSTQDLHLYMEYCGNGDLGRVIKDLQMKGQRAQESFVWSIFGQLVLALYRCHYGVDPPEVGNNILSMQGSANPKAQAGTVTILHRDLKPENVFLGEDNSVKLGDFGLSKMIKSQDFASTYVGTPFYMSPEICAAEKYTLKSDIWSLGCIIYELCAREPPFNAKTHFQLSQRIKEGKVAPLPEMYSPELNQVIRDCLKVNPDRRPDTAQLLNLPIVRMVRKEKEIVELSKALRSREEAARKKEQELSDRMASFEHERQAIRGEIDASLRREWEVKARLEIDRLVKAEVERLQKKFEEEVQARVETELKNQRKAAPPAQEVHRMEEYAPFSAQPDPHQQHHQQQQQQQQQQQSFVDNTSNDEFPSTTDATEYSVGSPDDSRESRRDKVARTPFGRAQTMFVGTPMDIEMISPSPMAIASLSLSPRRNGKTKVPTVNGNIFTAASAGQAKDSRWDQSDPTPMMESDDDGVAPSPTRHVKSSQAQNPFTSKSRPVLSSQKASSVTKVRSGSSNSGLVSKVVAHSQLDLRTRSPAGRLTKIPSTTSLQQQQQQQQQQQHESTGGTSRKTSSRQEPSLVSGSGSGSGTGSGSGSSNEALAKKSSSNVKGRTLVELQQARAGGRPLSAIGMGSSAGENSSPKRSASRVASGTSEPAAIWDPERDEMPSPFLSRQKRIARV
ncbi:G2-specific protein kinase nim-1 [Escovopsis weberi]|uniref:non-specific serine/threonine protein kinase n=1 Tax=Escovopsis weberi TaxID=150374 RepID=A0A0M9VVB5_ESCWE|nr:G2-specific protein kinase nim-1 [Escovopsis weberi]